MLHKTYKMLCAVLLLNLSFGCATKNTQIIATKGLFDTVSSTENLPLQHTFYLIGDAGNAAKNKPLAHFKALEKQLANSSKNATVLFL